MVTDAGVGEQASSSACIRVLLRSLDGVLKRMLLQ